MGAFFSNYQVRSDSQAAVVPVVRELLEARAYVSVSKNGWVSVFDENGDNHSEKDLEGLTGRFSERLQTTVISFRVHDSDVFEYWLALNGKLLDPFSSSPDYFGVKEKQENQRLAGDPGALRSLCQLKTEDSELRRALLQFAPDKEPGTTEQDQFVFAEDQLRCFAELLGINPSRAIMGFATLEQGEIEKEAGGRRQFKLIKSAGYEAVFKRNQKLFAAVEKSSFAEVESLLASGVDPNARDSIGQTAFMVALRKGKVDIARTLSNGGADIHAKHPEATIIGYAVSSGSPETVKFALECGADLLALDEQGRTPLLVALFCGHSIFADEIIRSLVAAGADVNQPGNPQGVITKLSHPGMTPLMCAARFGDLHSVRLLLELGADPLIRDAQGSDARSHAIDKLEKRRSQLQRSDVRAALGESIVKNFIAKIEQLEAIVTLLTNPETS